MKIGYVRVSTKEQNTARQEELMKALEVYIDRMSGKDMERPGLREMMNFVREDCYMVALNCACKVMGVFLISKGTVSASPISAREVYMRALLIGAVMIVLCHNHPSGSAEPSGNDIETTVRLKEAGILMGIRLADHIIIGSNGYYSFEESGLL